jgi:hypothetical protein
VTTEDAVDPRGQIGFANPNDQLIRHNHSSTPYTSQRHNNTDQYQNRVDSSNIGVVGKPTLSTEFPMFVIPITAFSNPLPLRTPIVRSVELVKFLSLRSYGRTSWNIIRNLEQLSTSPLRCDGQGGGWNLEQMSTSISSIPGIGRLEQMSIPISSIASITVSGLEQMTIVGVDRTNAWGNTGTEDR